MVAGDERAEVLVHTRLAADTVGATKMDRPEDIEPNPATGKVYLALTNNTNRGGPGRRRGRGEPARRQPRRPRHRARPRPATTPARTTFGWNILLVCGRPGRRRHLLRRLRRGQVSPISCPDNVAFDEAGNLWISTDGQPGTIGLDDALHRVTLTGEGRGRVEQFLAVPGRPRDLWPRHRQPRRAWSTCACSTRARTARGSCRRPLPRLPAPGHPAGRGLGRTTAKRHPGLPRLERGHPWGVRSTISRAPDTPRRCIRPTQPDLDRLPTWLTRRGWSRPGSGVTPWPAARDEGFTFFDWLSAVDRTYDEAAPGFDVTAPPARRRHPGRPARHPARGPGQRRRAHRLRHHVFAGAAWHERETYEMFGIDFAGFDDGTG